MTKREIKRLLILSIPYVVFGLVSTNLGEAWRMAKVSVPNSPILGLMGAIPAAFGNLTPSFQPFDLCVGVICGVGLRLAVYLKGKNAKKYRHNQEYGSARWGNAQDIAPFMAPKFEDNIILTQTERLMMSNRPANPKNARNKNVLIVGGSGSGKTRFWLKPNLLQCHSSYVVTDPKGSIVVECGNALLKKGYRIKIFNTINFKKSMHYNGLWMKLPADGTTKVSRSMPHGKDDMGRTIWQNESRTVSNTQLKAMVESYKERPRDSMLSNLAAKKSESRAATPRSAPKPSRDNAR